MKKKRTSPLHKGEAKTVASARKTDNVFTLLKQINFSDGLFPEKTALLLAGKRKRGVILQQLAKDVLCGRLNRIMINGETWYMPVSTPEEALKYVTR